MNGQSYKKEFNVTGTPQKGVDQGRTIPVERAERFPAEEQMVNNGVNTNVSLLDRGEIERYRMRWSEIQARFVDDPRASVSEADRLVADVVQQISKKLTEELRTLENQWSQGDRVSTEDLRQVLQHYRSVFNNLAV